MVLSVCRHFFVCITFLLLVCVSECLCMLALYVPEFHCMRVGYLRLAMFMSVSVCQWLNMCTGLNMCTLLTCALVPHYHWLHVRFLLCYVSRTANFLFVLLVFGQEAGFLRPRRREHTVAGRATHACMKIIELYYYKTLAHACNTWPGSLGV